MKNLLKVLGVLSLIGGAIIFISDLNSGIDFSLVVIPLVSGVLGFAVFFGMGAILEKVEELLYFAKKQEEMNLAKNEQKTKYKQKYKECPNCGELNGMFAGGCIKCNESLIRAKVVEK